MLNHIVSALRASEEGSLCSLYFTKESHIHTLLNLILSSHLPVVMPRMPPLDYFSSITFEVFEKTAAPGTSSGSASGAASPREPKFDETLGPSSSSSSGSSSSSPAPVRQRSLLISVSEGAHSSNVLSINLDARHALTPLPRRPLTKHIELQEALQKLEAHSLRIRELQGTEHIDTQRGLVDVVDASTGEQDSETGLLPVQKRRGSGDTDRTSVRTINIS